MELNRTSSSRSFRSHNNSASASDLERSSYKIISFTASSPASSVAFPSTSFYSHHIKFNISKLDEEMSQIENQLKNMSNFVSEIPLFKEESESISFFYNKSPLNINIIRKRNIKRNHFVLEVEFIKANYFSPENTAKRNYFQQLPSQVRNALRKQYEKYM